MNSNNFCDISAYSYWAALDTHGQDLVSFKIMEKRKETFFWMILLACYFYEYTETEQEISLSDMISRKSQQLSVMSSSFIC